MKPFTKNKLKSAFTMIELVFVIVIVGIISMMIAPSFDGNNVRQAADQVISHIRYTQHLAMMDNKFDTNNQFWYRNRWSIDLNSATNSTYSIKFEGYKDDGTKDTPTYASNPLTSTQILDANETPELNLLDEYGVTFNNGCSTNKIFFDYLGRPYSDAVNPAIEPYQNLLQNNCTIVISDGNVANDVTIELQPETGYVRIR